MGTVVAVLNQKGGAGKTTLATHLDRALAAELIAFAGSQARAAAA